MSLPECLQIMNCTNANSVPVDSIYRTNTILCRSYKRSRKRVCGQKALMVLEFESGANATRVRSGVVARMTVAVDKGEVSSGFSDLVHQPVPL